MGDSPRRRDRRRNRNTGSSGSLPHPGRSSLQRTCLPDHQQWEPVSPVLSVPGRWEAPPHPPLCRQELHPLTSSTGLSRELRSDEALSCPHLDDKRGVMNSSRKRNPEALGGCSHIQGSGTRRTSLQTEPLPSSTSHECLSASGTCPEKTPRL